MIDFSCRVLDRLTGKVENRIIDLEPFHSPRYEILLPTGLSDYYGVPIYDLDLMEWPISTGGSGQGVVQKSLICLYNPQKARFEGLDPQTGTCYELWSKMAEYGPAEVKGTWTATVPYARPGAIIEPTGDKPKIASKQA